MASRSALDVPRASRRLAYLAIGAGLAVGAPLGLSLVRMARWDELGAAAFSREVQQDLPTFLYVTLSTLAVFSAFGYALGRQADLLVALSRTDPLTGLGNQRAFEEGLVAEVARAARDGRPLSLLVVDVDGLKAINDRDGHEAGDVALRTVADALRRGARQTDRAARIGGDEFALLAPATALAEAFDLGERIRGLVAESERVAITISVGVATLDLERPVAGNLVRAGDGALYEAKRRGRNRVVAAAPGTPARESWSPGPVRRREENTWASR
jgi:diguanylate cyclase (GGDEF)-like protein